MKGDYHENRKERNPAIHTGIGEILYRNGAFGPPVPSGRGTGSCHRSKRNLRARSTYRLTYPSSGADAYRHCGMRSGAARGRSSRNHQAGRCGVVSPGGKTLAWCFPYHVHDPHRRSGDAPWRVCYLAGACQRRAVPRLKRLGPKAFMDSAKGRMGGESA